MKALAIKQPWAWLIVHGFKPVENRTWATKHRGKFLIHASASRPSVSDYEIARDIYLRSNLRNTVARFPDRDAFELGGIVGIVDLVDVVTDHSSPYFFGPIGFVLDKAKPCEHIPLKGKLNFFPTDIEEEDLVITRKRVRK